ncbi:unnamed protein product [Clavelina lepadiformis]|uniref:Uncharacterized protein n=2 Tax=Clavelina lepadiformis TaxID=159417 RepID=A0ABP0G3V3_CLALP
MDSTTELGDIEFPPGVKDVSSDMNPAELVKALKKCCKFFSQLEQDEEEMKRIYLPFCNYIVQDEFLKEIKDDNCRIHIGCILADVFRLHAPENPFRSGEKIKEIFMFLTEQLKQLRDPKGPLFAKAYHILENVATIKSYNICIDLDDSNAAGDIFCSLFRSFFSIVNSGHDKQLKSHMLDIMGFAITDSGSVPQSVLDIILECLLEKTRKMNPSAYELAQDLLRRTFGVIEQYLMMFFQNVILANRGEVSRLSSHWTKLIPELYKITPTLLLNTLPQLELKLRVDDPKERLQVVTLLSQMFSEKNSNLATQYPTLWNCFLGRFNDIDPEVRATCVTFYRHLIINLGRESPFSKEVVTFFKPRRHDTDETVRMAVVMCIRGIALKDLQLASDDLLEFLKERVLDKKWRVREAVIRAMGEIYKKYSVGSDTSRMHMRRLQSFKSKLLHVYYRQNLEDCLLLEHVMVSGLVPYSLPNVERMKQLLELYTTVDDRAVKAFIEMLKKQRRIRLALKDIVDAFAVSDDDDRNKIVWHKVVIIASQLPGNPQQARENLRKFINLAFRDAKIKQWLTYIVGDNYSSQKIAMTVRDLLKKLETDGEPRQVQATAQRLLERSIILPVILDSTSLKALFLLVKESLDGLSDIDELNCEDAQLRAMELLRCLSQLAPYLFCTVECFEELLGFLRRTKEDFVVLQSLTILQQTSSLIEENFTEIRSVLLPELKIKAKSGTPSQVKHAIYCINKFTSVREVPLMQVFDYCKEIATSANTPCKQMESVLTALGCIAEVLPEKVSSQLRGIVASIVVKQVIMKTNTGSNQSKGKRKEMKWCEKNELSKESKTKIAGMKCMVRWLQGLRSNDCDCCGSTLRLLQHMLHNDGDLMKSGNISKADMSHLRLQAAYCVLKIARVTEFKELFKPDIYQELAMLINDSVLEVRRNFVTKLYQTLYKFEIHISFLALFATVSQEKQKEQREHGSFLYHQLIKRIRDFNKQNAIGATMKSTMMPEYMLPYLIYLLANDPDFLEGISKRSLARIKDCIHFILDPLLTKDHPESYGFIKRLAENLKRSKNADNSGDVQRNENIYAVCDLVVQHVLQRSSQHAIAIIEPIDKSVVKFIPQRLYTNPSGPENNRVYLPREFYSNLKPVPTPAITAAMGGDKYRKNLAHQAARKPVPILSSPTSMTESTSQSSASSISLSQGKSPSPKRSTAQSSSSLPTPPTSQTTSSQSDDLSKPALPAVRTSGRKRKPRNLSPPLPMTSQKRSKPLARHQKTKTKTSNAEDSMGDEASGSDDSMEENDSLEESSSTSKSKESSKTSRGRIDLRGKRSVIASASVKTKPRKTLGVNNGNGEAEPTISDNSVSVRRSNRRRGK